MKPLTLEQVLIATKASAPEIPLEVETIRGVSVDSRTLKAGELFIPLVGENFDGHDFIPDAFEKGAIASLCEKRCWEEVVRLLPGKIIIKVPDTQEALLDLSGYYRLTFDLPFVAITGSVGKTTTKDMIGQVLGERFDVLKTQGNYNNEVGLPLTLLNIEDYHEVGVVELGMRGMGEIRRLAQRVKPRVAVITNIGISHIERLGSKDNIARAKLEVLEVLEDDGIAIMNGDCPELWRRRDELPVNILYFGIEKGDLRGCNISDKKGLGMEFDICGKYGKARFEIPLPGLHNVYNALSAIAVGYHFGLTTQEIQRGLRELKPSKMRLEIKRSPSGAMVIDDTYNASPDSVKAALEILKTSGDFRGAVLGDMLELGKHADKAHFDIGHWASRSADILLAVGDFADTIAEGAVFGGMDRERIFIFNTTQDALEKVESLLFRCDAILVKASRAMRMEKISQRLVGGD